MQIHSGHYGHQPNIDHHEAGKTKGQAYTHRQAPLTPQDVQQKARDYIKTGDEDKGND